MQICPSCNFQNPRAWLSCARCGFLFQDEEGSEVQFRSKDKTQVESPPDPPSAEEIAGEFEAEESTTLAEDMHRGAEGGAILVGQTKAAQALHRSIQHSFEVSKTTLTTLKGPRGSGRTRLLIHASEVAARLESDVQVLYGSCRGGGADGSYSPLSRILLERFDVQPSSAPSVVRGKMATSVGDALKSSDAISVAETTHLLGFLAGVPFPDSPFLAPLQEKHDERHRRACLATQRFFEGDASERPTVLLLDNMHHAEPDVWDVLEELQRAHAKLAIVIAGDESIQERSQAMQASGGTQHVDIEPLSEEEISAMLFVLLPTLVEAPEPLVAAITHKTSGNPSALLELVRSLHEAGLFLETEEGLVTDDAQLRSGELSISLEDAVQSRLERLTDAERQTLDRASIMGETFWDWGLLSQKRGEQSVSDSDDPLDVWPDDADIQEMHTVLRSLLEKRFITYVEGSSLPGAHEFTFAFAGTRDLVYTQMDADVQTERHAAVARWMQAAGEFSREAVAAMIGPHLEKAGMERRAGRAYLEASAYAVARSRTEVAHRFVVKALPLIEEHDVLRRIEALHTYGSVLTTMGQYDESLDAFTEMLREAWGIGARGKAGAALNRIARIHRGRGDEELSRVYLERALTLFRSANDVRGVAATLDDLAQVALLRSDLEQALPLVREALELRRSIGDTRGQALSLNTAGQIEMRLGDFDQAHANFQQALQIRESVGDRAGVIQSYNALGVLAFERNDTGSAIEHWTAALGHAADIADRRSECFLLNNLGEARVGLGEFETARTCLERAKRLSSELGDKRSAAEVERNLGLVLLRMNDATAEETLLHALELAEGYGSGEAIAFAHRAMGTMHAQTVFDDGGETSNAAEESFLTSIDIFRASGNEKEAARSLAALGYYLVERGDIEGARERLREARGVMRSLGLSDSVDIDQTLNELG